jgi:hypothetical protein
VSIAKIVFDATMETVLADMAKKKILNSIEDKK